MKTYFWVMRPPDFQFQQFSIWQDRCAMKVGTDAILLGALTPVAATAKSIIDIGTGTGILPLMLAQRFPEVRITGVEIDTDAAQQASENVEASPFNQRITIVEADWLKFKVRKQVDHIVSNPPFHAESVIAAQRRGRARHTGFLPPNDLLTKAMSVVNPYGRITLIGPPSYIQDSAAILLRYGWTMCDLVKVQPKMEEPPHRWLATWSASGQSLTATTIAIREQSGRHTKAFQEATADFYVALS